MSPVGSPLRTQTRLLIWVPDMGPPPPSVGLSCSPFTVGRHRGGGVAETSTKTPKESQKDTTVGPVSGCLVPGRLQNRPPRPRLSLGTFLRRRGVWISKQEDVSRWPMTLYVDDVLKIGICVFTPPLPRQIPSPSSVQRVSTVIGADQSGTSRYQEFESDTGSATTLRPRTTRLSGPSTTSW